MASEPEVPKVDKGEEGWDLGIEAVEAEVVMIEDGSSGGKEFLPMRLFNIRPATLNTDIFRFLMVASAGEVTSEAVFPCIDLGSCSNRLSQSCNVKCFRRAYFELGDFFVYLFVIDRVQ